MQTPANNIRHKQKIVKKTNECMNFRTVVQLPSFQILFMKYDFWGKISKF